MTQKPNYLDLLQNGWPELDAYATDDPFVYENIVITTEGGVLPPKEELDALQLPLAQKLAWKRIQELRDLRKGQGIKVGDNWFHSDDTSRIQFIALVMLGANMPAGIMWKTMQGTFVTMTPQLASGIFQTIIGTDSQVFTRAEAHRQAMLLSEDPLAYDITTNWPMIYNESQEAVVARAAGMGEGA